MTLITTIHCPTCGHARPEAMPTDSCVVVYICVACLTGLRPKPGDCCVFCSYADHPCPPMQGGAESLDPSA